MILVFANLVWAIWVDADGSGQESINISTNTGNSENPSLYLDSSRNPHISWFDSTEVDEEIYYLKWNGTEWVDADDSGQESINISNTVGSSYQPSLCLDSSGKPHIAWKDYTPGKFEIYYLKWSGTEWVDADDSEQESINISNTSTDSYHPSLCLDSSGNPHIAWHDSTSGNNEIYYLKWDGTEWVDADGSGQESINVSTNTGSSEDPSLYLDNSGNPHIAWHDSTSGNEEVYYLKWDGEEWVDVAGSSAKESINVSNRPGDSGYASLCLDNAGNPHIAWYDFASGNNDIYYLKWNGTEWVDADGSGQGSINVSNNDGISIHPSLCLDNSGNPHIAWHNSHSENNEIYYLKWDGEEWVDGDGSGQESINISTNSGDSSYPSLYLDSSENPHIAWKDKTLGNYDIYYLKWNDAPALSWTGETNYANDGLHPETGYRDTDFVYRVKYTDVNNDAAASGYPRVHIMKGGIEIAGSPFVMSEVDAGDTTYNDGKLYTYIKSGLPAPGEDYTYYFEAKDVWNSPATGEPITPRDGPIVESSPPVLKVDPSSLDFGVVRKGETKVKTFTISNLGPGTLSGTITTDKTWISVAPASFSDSYSTVSVTVNTDTLETWRRYTGTITVDSNGGVETVTVSITPLGFFVNGEVKIQGGENGYVNPLKGEKAKIHFEPSGPGTVNVKIFTLIGLLVWEKSKDVSPVQDFIEWNCRNTENDVVASGIYVVYVEGPGIKATKKVAILK